MKNFAYDNQLFDIFVDFTLKCLSVVKTDPYPLIEFVKIMYKTE